VITGVHWHVGHTKTVFVGLGIISAKTKKKKKKKKKKKRADINGCSILHNLTQPVNNWYDTKFW